MAGTLGYNSWKSAGGGWDNHKRQSSQYLLEEAGELETLTKLGMSAALRKLD